MTLDGIELPENLYWQDETAFKPFASSQEWSVSGALVLEYQALSYGRPITLTGGWITRADLAVLQAMESVPANKRTLVLNDTTTHSVQFDLAAGGIESSPLWPTTTPDDSTEYTLTLHLITVEPDAE
ncbi:hypothetical protein [Oceanobacter mangrovi]|uniref:hypothetical protein n=1 Tax=Oceanobacter mangrovi TaxID=2862510 RepID=UPI001C8D33DD|nr:hypothetical protein [Oceanobacter mangrovi]